MFNLSTRTREPSSSVRTGATRSRRKSERYLELKVRLGSTRRVLTSLTPHPDSLSDRLGADEAVPRQVFEREPGCHQASAATLPDYVGEGFAVLIYYGPRLVLKSAESPDDCFHQDHLFLSPIVGKDSVSLAVPFDRYILESQRA